MRRRIIQTAVVIGLFALGLSVVWYFDELRRWYEFINGTRLVLTIVLVLGLGGALYLIWCRTLCPCSSCMDGKSDESQDTDENDQSPYPSPDWKCISDYTYPSDLKFMRLKKAKTPPGVDRETQYIVTEYYTISYSLDGKKRRWLTVPKGMRTDLVSVPLPFRFYVGRVGPHLESCIVHDYLYRAWEILGICPTEDKRLFADQPMLAGMRAAGMGTKANVIYLAVHWFARCAFFKKKLSKTSSPSRG